MKYDTEFMSKLNKMIRETLDDYYRHHDAENFFRIDDILKFCVKQEFTKDDVPALIEMRNVIVMG